MLEEQRQDIRERLAELNPEALLADGFEDAFVGIGQQFSKHLAVYDYDRCIDVLMQNGASFDEAVEYMDFNVTGAWVGVGTPIFLHTLESLEL